MQPVSAQPLDKKWHLLGWLVPNHRATQFGLLCFSSRGIRCRNVLGQAGGCLLSSEKLADIKFSVSACEFLHLIDSRTASLSLGSNSLHAGLTLHNLLLASTVERGQLGELGVPAGGHGLRLRRAEYRAAQEKPPRKSSCSTSSIENENTSTVIL